MKTPKNKLRVVVLTDEYRIEAEAHLFQNARLSDLLNSDSTKKEFIPLTDVTVYNKKSSSILYQLDFLNLNKSCIVMIFVDKDSSNMVRFKLKEIRAKISKFDYEGARSALDEVLEIDPTCAEAMYLCGVVNCKTAKYKDALVFFKKVVELAPENSQLALSAFEMINQIK